MVFQHQGSEGRLSEEDTILPALQDGNYTNCLSPARFKKPQSRPPACPLLCPLGCTVMATAHVAIRWLAASLDKCLLRAHGAGTCLPGTLGAGRLPGPLISACPGCAGVIRGRQAAAAVAWGSGWPGEALAGSWPRFCGPAAGPRAAAPRAPRPAPGQFPLLEPKSSAAPPGSPRVRPPGTGSGASAKAPKGQEKAPRDPVCGPAARCAQPSQEPACPGAEGPRARTDRPCGPSPLSRDRGRPHSSRREAGPKGRLRVASESPTQDSHYQPPSHGLVSSRLCQLLRLPSAQRT
ncbi:PREDICTED: keratinocyte proline-rich protein-like [Chinchilla lanigera]|uniref:keratinocyte proline-rich protein-like n=1 Tax=Chinchilla lanigera TaxID=34839 RepID=UPI00069600ED|nr:PREDICTED: keratinocyte proline-rich protein-like [Chinchilla lanigera]